MSPTASRAGSCRFSGVRWPVFTRAANTRARRRCLARSGKASQSPVFPPSSTVQKKDGFFLRLYEPYVALEVDYIRRADGYDAIAAYFEGCNSDGIKFQEVQPIILNYLPDGAKMMQLFVGPTTEGDVVEKVPQPTMAGSRLVAAGGELVAVLPFEGYITPDTAQNAVSKLKGTLQKAGLALADTDENGRFRICQYGPIFSFTGRVNELLLQISV